MTEIYLIRHTQAEGNRYRIMQGHWDGGVTALGEREIELLAERFRGIAVDAVYSSDLYRARRTAGAVTRWGKLPLHIDPRLREIHVGPWETQFFGNVFHDEPELARRFLCEQESFRLAGAETFAEVGERAMAALRDILRENAGRTVAIVSHGVTLRCILSRLLDIPLRDTQRLPLSPNTGVTHLTFEGEQVALDYLNDASHLAPLGEAQRARIGSVRHERLDPGREPDFYRACYADAWLGVHGSLEGFSAPVYLNAAKAHHRAEPDSVLRLLLEEETIGLIDLDPARGRRVGCGWLSLLYLKPEYRGQGYGIQALARAYRFCAEHGRRRLRLNVAAANERALRFYRREGFRVLSGADEELLLLEKNLEEARHD